MDNNTKSTHYYIFMDEHGTPQMVVGTPIMLTPSQTIAQSVYESMRQPTTPTSVFTLSYEVYDECGDNDYGTEVYSSREGANKALEEWFVNDLRDYLDDEAAPNFNTLMDGRERYLRRDGTETTYPNADIVVCYGKGACYRIYGLSDNRTTRVWIKEQKAKQ